MHPADPLPARTAPPRGTPPRTAVVALGSIVMGDDGAGAAVLAELEAGWELPEALDRVDLGTPGPYFAEYVRGYENLVIIDALRSPGDPGTIKTFNESTLTRVPAGGRLTPHVLDLGEALAALEFEGAAPKRVRVVGIVPAVVRAGTELSPAVHEAVPQAAEAVVEALQALGWNPVRRAERAPAEAWWSDDAAPATASSRDAAGSPHDLRPPSPLLH